MNHSSEIKEIVHTMELTDTEFSYLKTICRGYLEDKQDLPKSLHEIKLAEEILKIDETELKELPLMKHVKIDEVVDARKIKEDLGIITTSQSKASELLDMKAIFINNSDLVEDGTEDYEYNVMIGKQGQLGIKGYKEIQFQFMNKNCAKLVKDFILQKGTGSYYGYAAQNYGKWVELSLYIDADGNTSFGNVFSEKKLILRYNFGFDGTPFEIVKDGSLYRLNPEQAFILAKFIERHY